MSKNKPNTSNHAPLALIAVIVIIGLFGILKTDIYKLNPDNDYRDELATEMDWKRITNPQSLFFTQIYLDRTKTNVTVPMKFDDATKISWLTLTSTESAKPVSFLMTHPLLEKIDWPFVKKDLVYLYQRQKDYPSIDAFIANPPPRNKIAIEPELMQFDAYKDVPGYPLDEAFNPDFVDYILTTFTNPQKQGDVYFYQNTIDASKGIINQNGNLTWQITVPEASSKSAYYLGNIQVEYDQTK